MSFEEFKTRWSGMVTGHRAPAADLQLEAILESQSDTRGGSLPFKGLASDGEIYWIKPTSNRQSSRVPTTEQLVAGMGRLIDAPVCKTRLMTIPQDFHGEVLDNGTVLESGIVHASHDVGNCAFDKWYEPQYRPQDDNRRRHAGYFALFDWCWGDDMQWLYDLEDDRKTYSHDHGHFLPGSPDWTVETLLQSAQDSHELSADGDGLDDNELSRLAERLESLTIEEIAGVIRGIPAAWPVSDEELETAGAFFDFRRIPAAGRLRALAERLQIGS
ncbi:hypothetical protein [Novipirellula sp.]|uniref:hypothetical protein n=1 Tax=Novipirellula sp. TaxID=2795430 RepID=UPI003563F58F